MVLDIQNVVTPVEIRTSKTDTIWISKETPAIHTAQDAQKNRTAAQKVVIPETAAKTAPLIVTTTVIVTKAIQVHKETPTVQLTTIEQVQAAVGNQQKPNKEREVQATEKV